MGHLFDLFSKIRYREQVKDILDRIFYWAGKYGLFIQETDIPNGYHISGCHTSNIQLSIGINITTDREGVHVSCEYFTSQNVTNSLLESVLKPSSISFSKHHAYTTKEVDKYLSVNMNLPRIIEMI